MNNETIIWNARVRLMKEGIIGGTGRTIEVKDADGNPVKMQEPQQIHTYAGWCSLGYQVRKGEEAIARFKIWKHTIRQKKSADGTEKTLEEKLILTPAYFFSEEQVEKRK